MTGDAAGLSTAHLATLWRLAKQLHQCATAPEAEALAREAAAAGERSSAMDRAIADTIRPALAAIRERQRLRSLATRDPLTGLFNRGFMEEELIRLVHQMKRLRRPMAVAMIDLDHFRSFNEDHGHLAGDLVLRSVAAWFAGFRRGSDVACRYGGDEFVLIMPEALAVQAMTRIDPLLSRLAEPTILHEHRCLPRVTASVGVAEFPTDATTAITLLRAADEALYHGKQAGRNRICLATAARHDAAAGETAP
jgi:diguanylate cyclase (GGDEF)-like protein